ncbi:MAG: arginine repressor [Bacteroidaceae bacterium]|nr:arginine repressor [Bacteroidaceae bacterium]
MRNKDTRLEVIKMIISNQELSRQEDLLAELFKAGFPATQSTLSRDLKQLKIVKAQNKNGRYVYMMPNTRIYRTVSDHQLSVSAMNKRGILSVKFTGNIAVVKTPPGHAAHVAYDIDMSDTDIILGTVAGDDTVLVACQEGADREQVMAIISHAGA